MAGAPDLVGAVRPFVAITFAEASEKSHHGQRFMFCQCDVRNPCWEPSYSASGWGEHGAGKHWGGGEACAECKLREAVFAAGSPLLETIVWNAIENGLPDAETNVLLATKAGGEWGATFEGFYDGEDDRYEDAPPLFRDVTAAPLDPREVTHWVDMPRGPLGRRPS
jgi:hypothetical protein